MCPVLVSKDLFVSDDLPIHAIRIQNKQGNSFFVYEKFSWFDHVDRLAGDSFRSSTKNKPDHGNVLQFTWTNNIVIIFNIHNIYLSKTLISHYAFLHILPKQRDRCDSMCTHITRVHVLGEGTYLLSHARPSIPLVCTIHY